MNRRDFLKLSSMGSLAVITAQFTRKFPSVLSADVLPGVFAPRLGKQLFKGSSDGRILVSTDGGQTWRCCTNFGRQCQVKYVYTVGSRLFAMIGIPAGTFELVSADGIVWRTTG